MSELPDREAINALFAGNYAAPFSLPGMHRTRQSLEVRALLPEALGVWVIETATGCKLAQLLCEDARGFFSGVIPRRKNLSAISWR